MNTKKEIIARISELEKMLLTPISDRMVYVMEIARLKHYVKVKQETELSSYYCSKEQIESHKKEWAV